MKQPMSREYNVTNTHCLLTQYLKHNRVSCAATTCCDNETWQKTMEQTVAYKRKWREKVWSLKWKSTRSISRKLRTTDILPQRIFYYRIKIAASSKVSSRGNWHRFLDATFAYQGAGTCTQKCEKRWFRFCAMKSCRSACSELCVVTKNK